MTRRQRTLLGAIVIPVYVCIYALMAMALAQGRVQELGSAGQAIVYVVLGLAWIVPLFPMIKWMAKNDRPA
jgi:hypothetical protein